MSVILYISKYTFPMNRTMSMEDYDSYELILNEPFICGLVVALSLFCPKSQIGKYIMIQGQHGIQSVYDYVKEHYDLEKYFSISSKPYYIPLIRKYDDIYGYIQYKNKDFIRGFDYIFSYFERKKENYLL